MGEAGLSAAQRYQCPQCGDPDRLWEEVTFTGWRGLDTTLKPNGQREVDSIPNPVGLYVGCGQCDWRGLRSALVRIGADDQPLDEPIPGQLEIP